ncbi:16S rRNA (adenine(1518)-N(6)/adenine(1519)-N(6))-dimethyltransferase RsmA [Nitrososphaera sp.]|uniref:16S rRNA (adenine(1518)-N(6)/adenine(1519)-N(6))- dimethyltransferase RsmA n=1 Tax=Nitrososphaera sp. TaxID=1971748 RepID=UPI00307F1043
MHRIPPTTTTAGRTQALGQHFLIDAQVAARIIEASAVDRDERVCEAGTGNGALTKALCARARSVVSFEIDRRLYENARKWNIANLELVNADIFRQQGVEFDVFVSNLPYSRSRDALQWLATRKRFRRAIVMVQAEFADKLAAMPGDENYRAISAISSYCFSIERLFRVGRDAFDPPPRVDSEVARLVPRRRRGSDDDSATPLLTASAVKKINWLFSQRNKKASKVAARIGAGGILPAGDGRRIDQLTPEEIVSLATAEEKKEKEEEDGKKEKEKAGR